MTDTAASVLPSFRELAASVAETRRAAHRGNALAADDPVAVVEHRSREPEMRLSINSSSGEVVISGVASATGAEYEMWDMFGPYMEVVAAGAFTKTLGNDPMVLFTVNHEGLGLASTRKGSLVLAETAEGLTYEATMPLKDPEVYSLATKIERGTVTESSMMFYIRDAHWNEAMDRRTITEIDLDRGDVSAVLYGANPNTSIDVAKVKTSARNDDPPAAETNASPELGEAAAARRDAHGTPDTTDAAGDATERADSVEAELAILAATIAVEVAA